MYLKTWHAGYTDTKKQGKRMLKIVESPHPLLNQVCEPCELNDSGLENLARQMEEAMYASDGVGLAAPQVGVLKRIIVIDTSPEDVRDPRVLVNPEILEKRGELEVEEEGCLSCPGIAVPIARSPWVKVSYYDLEGNECLIEGDGLLARCLQHEIDHLNGITLFESASPRERIKALKAYEEAKQAGARPGDTHIPDSSRKRMVR